MSNRFIKKIPMYFIKEGSKVEHELYGKGTVIASYPKSGFVDLQFSDGHIENGYDIKDKIVPQIYKVEAFKCPVTDTEILAERCACIKDGIHACDYYKADMEKQASICTYESEMKKLASVDAINKETENDSKAKENAIKQIKELCDKALKAAKFEDVLGSMKEVSAEDLQRSVIHKVTGKKGKIEKQVADNAVLVNWRNQEECPCKTVVTNTEISPDSDCKLIDKINKLREKFKKFVKPINEFFSKKKASVETIKVNAEEFLKKASFMTIDKKERYVKILKAQLNSKGIDVDTNSIVLSDNGEAIVYNVVYSNNDILSEEIPLNAAKDIIKDLGYEGDVLKIYASLKAQVSPHTEGYLELQAYNISGDEELKSLF